MIQVQKNQNGVFYFAIPSPVVGEDAEGICGLSLQFMEETFQIIESEIHLLRKPG